VFTRAVYRPSVALPIATSGDAALTPHALTTNTRTKARKLEGNPDALTAVVLPTLPAEETEFNEALRATPRSRRVSRAR
jgi:hypothetical protein